MEKNISKIFVLLIFIFTTLSAVGQTYKVSGKITDTKTGKSINNVNVSIEGTTRGVISDDKGYYSIKAAKGEIIVFSCVGYKVVKHTVIKEENNFNLKLEIKEYDFGGITVEGNKYENTALKIDIPIKEIPLTVNIVTAKTLEERNVTDMVEAIKNVNGVRGINRYGGFQTFRFRGFNNFVMMVDGVRDERHNQSTSAPQTNLANVEKIEVVKGPESVLFGHSALGGIINIIRKRPTRHTKYNYAVSYGSFNSKKMSGGIGGSLSNSLRYRADFGITETDGWRKFGQRTANGYVALSWDVSNKDVLEIQVGANKDKYDTDTGIPVLKDGSFPKGLNISTRYNDPADFLKHTRYDFQINYSRRFSENTLLRNKASYYFDDIDYLSTESLEYNSTLDSLKRSYPYYFNHMTYPFQNQLEVTHKFTISGMESRLLAGYALGIMHRKTYRGEIFGKGKYATIAVKNPILNQGYIDYRDKLYNGKDETYHGFYLQNWLKVTPKLKFLVGLRFDIFRGTYYTDQVDKDRNLIKEGKKTDMNKNSLTYRIGVVNDFTDELSAYASYSTYFKPSRRITYDGKVFDPENGYQGEVGIRYNYQNLLNLNVAGFYIKKKDIVEYIGRDKDGNKIYAQVGAAESKGIEFDMQLNIHKNFDVNAGYSYCKATFLDFTDKAYNKNEGNFLRYAPEHMIKIWGNLKVIKGLGISAGLNFIGENYTTTSNTYKLPSYTVVDASLYYNFGNKEIRLNINNLFDEEYFRDAIAGNQFFPGAERNVNLMFRFYN